MGDCENEGTGERRNRGTKEEGERRKSWNNGNGRSNGNEEATGAKEQRESREAAKDVAAENSVNRAMRTPAEDGHWMPMEILIKTGPQFFLTVRCHQRR